MTEEIKEKDDRKHSKLTTMGEIIIEERLRVDRYVYFIGEKIVVFPDKTSERMELIYSDPPYPRD